MARYELYIDGKCMDDIMDFGWRHESNVWFDVSHPAFLSEDLKDSFRRSVKDSVVIIAAYKEPEYRDFHVIFYGVNPQEYYSYRTAFTAVSHEFIQAPYSPYSNREAIHFLCKD